MVLGAINKGLKEICFTEHIDYEYPDESIVFDFDLNKYNGQSIELRKKYEGPIRIKKGVEVGVQPHLLDTLRRAMEDEKFDFIICSMHTTERKDFITEIFVTKTIEDAYLIYYNELLDCVKNYQQFSFSGILILLKDIQTDNVTIISMVFCNEIFNVIIPAGKGIELNTSGVRYGLPNGLPSDDILKLYKQCGGEIITLGSDAHNEIDIAFQFRESLHLLKTIGFNYVATFENMEPTFHPIDKLI